MASGREDTALLRKTVPPVLLSVLMLILLATVSGCPQYNDASVPNEINRSLEPETKCDYFLYVPSRYKSDAAWPLVILCHGTRPWDTAHRQMLDWVKLAEEKGFIVAAPELTGTSAAPQPTLEQQISRQGEDERRLLAVVRALRGAYNISDDRVFLTGWSAGGFAVLYTGLRNPQVFRAIAVQQGNFDAAYLADVADHVDPQQPVAVIYGAVDLLTGKDAKACIEWLEEQHANLSELEIGGGHRGHPEPTQEFFESVLRRDPWLHIRCFSESADPLEVRFDIRGSFAPKAFAWSFGDGGESPIAKPVHRYAEAGKYLVTLNAVTPDGRKVTRSIELQVPQRQLLTPQRTSWDKPKSP